MKLTLDEALRKGVEAQKAGQVQEADRYYTAILKANSKHPDANHNMGVLAVGVGKVEEALLFFETALEANPNLDQFWLSYIDALIQLKRMDEAKALFNQAKTKGSKGDGFDQIEKRLSSEVNKASKTQEPSQDQLQPLIDLYTQGQLERSLEQTKALTLEFPNSALLLNMRGVILKGLKQFDLSIEAYKKAISLRLDFVEAYYNLGNVLKDKRKLDEAVEAYKKALSINPNYAEAHYNLGNVLKDKRTLDEAVEAYKKAVSIKHDYAEAYNNLGNAFKDQGKLDKAIEAYQKALSIKHDYAEAYNNLGLSNIDALAQLNRIAGAEELFDLAKSNNSYDDNRPNFQKVSKSALNDCIKVFYTNLSNEIIKSAAGGWFYDIWFDQKFFTTNRLKKNKSFSNKSVNNGSAEANSVFENPFNLTGIIDELNKTSDLKRRFRKLEVLNSTWNKVLFSDSFSEQYNMDLIQAQEETFKGNELNVVVIGAGPCGLYLANALKHKLKDKINILVLDTNCRESHFKKHFSRRWLTHLKTKYFEDYFDYPMRCLAGSFGNNGYIGLPINLIETLLLISSKRVGVKFYFEKAFDYSMLDNSLVDFVFDASGGRLPMVKKMKFQNKELKLKLPNFKMMYHYSEVESRSNARKNNTKETWISLRRNGKYYYPHFKGNRLALPMMKLTKLPTSMHPVLIDFVKLDFNHRFFIWTGSLVDELNEILVIINLTKDEYIFFKDIIHDTEKLSIEIINRAGKGRSVNEDLLRFLQICAADESNQIRVNSPFISEPLINLNPLDQEINGIVTYPVGDTLFRGNPKIGNGLRNHLDHISRLVEIISDFKNNKDEDSFLVN